MTRYKRALLAIIFLCLSFFSFQSISSAKPPDNGRTMADGFVDEELVYGISFWFFDEVARGKMTLKKGGGGEYIAVLTAYTIGAIDRIFLSRKDTYISRMRLSDDGKRFVSKTFEKAVEIGSRGTRKTVTHFDYNKRLMTWKASGGGKEDKGGEVPIPKGIWCDDPITAFYNFRAGVYGPHEEGREFRIYTFPKEDYVPEIYLRILTAVEKMERLGRQVPGFLTDAKIDKEFFGQKTGDMEILFSEDMVPVEAVAKDIVFFGDVRGRLERIAGETDGRKASAPSSK